MKLFANTLVASLLVLVGCSSEDVDLGNQDAGNAGTSGSVGSAGSVGGSGGGVCGSAGSVGGSGGGVCGSAGSVGGSGGGVGGSAGSVGDGGYGGAAYCNDVLCDQPPVQGGFCLDANTLRWYIVPGYCEAGTCSYMLQDAACANGCSNGQCN